MKSCFFFKRKYVFTALLLFSSLISIGCMDKYSYFIDEDFDLTYEVGSTEPNWLSGIRVDSSKEGMVDTSHMTYESNVDMNTVGTYTVTYLSRGNVVKEVEISIVDTTGPTIQFRPDLNRVIYMDSNMPDFSTYIDVVQDNYYEVSKNDVVIDSSAFQHNVIGEYDVIFTLTDDDDNSTSETITFEVKVRPILDVNLSTYNFTYQVDSEKPDFRSMIISVNGIDGTISKDNVHIDDSDIDMSTLGVYEVIFTITDQNTVQIVTYDVTIIDTTAPVIELDESLQTLFYGECTVEDFSTYIKTVYDNYDSLSIDDVIITNPLISNNTPGLHVVSFTVTDLSNNETTVTLEIVIVLLENPVINLDPAFPTEYNIGDDIPDFRDAIESISVTYGSNDIDDVYIYEGAHSGPQHHEIEEINWTEPGEYTILFSFTSDYGLYAAVSLPITIDDYVAPVIVFDDTLPTTYVEDSEEPDWTNYILSVSDNYDNITVDDVQVFTYTVDMNDAGEFYISYSLADSSGNTSNEALLITITENNNPEINFNPIFRTMYGVLGDLPDFTDLVTSVDSFDESLTINDVVIDTSQVNMNIVGDYPVIVSLTDSENRTGTRTLMLEIRDTTNALITWNYDFDLELTLGDDLPDFINAVDSVSDNYVTVTLDDVVIDASAVDMNTEGSYVVTFSISDGSSTATRTRTFTVVERSRLYKVPHVGGLTILTSTPFNDGYVFILEDDEEIFVIKFNSDDEIEFKTTIYDKTATNFISASIYDSILILDSNDIFISGYYRTDDDLISQTLLINTTTGAITHYLEAPMFTFEYDDGTKVIYFYNWATKEIDVYDYSIHSTRLITDPTIAYDFLYPNVYDSYQNHFIMYETHEDDSEYITLFKNNFMEVEKFMINEDDQYGFMHDMFYVTNGTNEITIVNLTDSTSTTVQNPYVIGTEYIFTINEDAEESYDITRIGPNKDTTVVIDKHDDYKVDPNSDYIYTLDYTTNPSGNISTLSVYRPKETTISENITDHNVVIKQDDYTGNVYFVNENPGDYELYTYFNNSASFLRTIITDNSAFDFIIANNTTEFHIHFTETDVNETTIYIKQDGVINGSQSLILNHTLTDIDVIYSHDTFIIFSGNDGTTEYLYYLDLLNTNNTVYTTPYSASTNYQANPPIVGDDYITIFSTYSIISDTFTNITSPSTVIDTKYSNKEVRVYEDCYNGEDIIMISYDVFNGQDYTNFYLGNIEDGIQSMTLYSYNYRFTSLLIDNSLSTRAFGYIPHDNQAMLLFSDTTEDLLTVHYFNDSFYVVDDLYFEYHNFFNTSGNLETKETIYTR